MRAYLSIAILASLVGCATGEVRVDCDGGCRPPDAAAATDGPAGDAAGECPPPAACNGEALCTVLTCNGTGWTCGREPAGAFAWTTSVAGCDDGDDCTSGDHCQAGTCTGAPVLCTTPPAPQCLSSSTLQTYAATGTCGAAGCTYAATDIPCPANDCHGGTCSADPCAAVTCTTPPDACHAATGTCAAGVCSYASKVCNTPPDLCHEAAGTCTNGTCTYAPKALNCARPHTTGGACQPGTGQCGGWTCAAGWGNCTTTWDDGCETPTNTINNCGGCGTTCSAGAHATADCSSGTCVRTCQSPWQSCDGDWSNGCEIPVGVSGQCDKAGLNSTSGCGTAYCGSSASSSAQNFAGWYCSFCSHCHNFTSVPAGDAWCLYGSTASGQWSPARCTNCCSVAEHDNVCAP
ncbi:MAG TPA: hypothetical protein VGQ83_04460 [Polyangia bacterium]|jgi:hypothetical protein